MATIGAALGYQLRAFPSSPASSTAASLIDIIRSENRVAPDEANGAITGGTTVFDDDIPGVANLDPALLAALRLAASDAADDGIQFFVNSGWRSAAYQEQLLREAVSRYGSEREAARWVATADTSPHVSGDAVDIGRSDATAWLAEHGADYGLCQIYSNEPWHYELRPEAIDRGDRGQAPAPQLGAPGHRSRGPARSDNGCPPMYADATQDPRMQQ